VLQAPRQFQEPLRRAQLPEQARLLLVHRKSMKDPIRTVW